MDDLNINSRPKQLILLAHGSRDENWCRTFESGLDIINEKLADNACLAYMEMASPGLDAVIAKGYEDGVRHFEVLPLFFAAGRHLLHDVPEQIRLLHENYPSARIGLLEAVGKYDGFWHALGMMIANRAEGEI